MKVSKYQAIKFIIVLAMLVITNWAIFNSLNFNMNYKISFEVLSKETDTYQVFYVIDGDWSETNSVINEYLTPGKYQKLEYDIPGNVTKIRIDTGNKNDNVVIKEVFIEKLARKISLVESIIALNGENGEINAIQSINNDNGKVHILTSGTDPYFVIGLSNIDMGGIDRIGHKIDFGLKIAISIIISIILIIMAKKGDFLISLIKELLNNRKLIWNLSKNDFKTRYAGSYLGIIWAFVQPVIIVIIYWFVFQVGFRSAAISNFPYILWLVSGIVPWFFFNEAVSNSTSSMLEYSYLVKKVVFKISILPIVKITSSLFVHAFFYAFTILLFGLYGYFPDLYMIQAIYYTVCAYALVLGISYFTSSVIVFFRDLGQIIAIILQIGMWLTPILWSYTMIPAKYSFVYKLNPIYYIVEGYRDSFINKVWFWEKVSQTMYFWMITLVVFYFGISIFRKLKVHFADVL